MLSVNYIRDIKFGSSVGGYKKDEVDDFVEQVLQDYSEYERALKAAVEKIDDLTAETEKMKASEDSIQNVLLSAQRLADSIVEEAKVKSAQIVREAEQSITHITEKERELSAAFERKAAARREEIEREIADKIAEGERKKEAVDKATADSVRRQQILFNRLRVEISAFKSEINKRYKEHLESLSRLPDEVPSSPDEIAAAVSEAFDKAPAPESFFETKPAFEQSGEFEFEKLVAEADMPVRAEEKEKSTEDTAEDLKNIKPEEDVTVFEPKEKKAKAAGGFVITSDE